MRFKEFIQIVCFFLCIAFASPNASFCFAADWPSWRGPNQNGVSSETGLISKWSLDGENLIWHAEFIGRSTPIVMNGRVYVIGRVGADLTQQEVVACYDAQNGGKLWEHRFNVFLTTVPFNRVGWTSLAGDPETGNVYASAVGGMFICYNRNGKILWWRSLTEEFGRFSGYGGRTMTPVVDENLVIMSFLNTGWGDQSAMGHRYVAFDKRTGEIVWIFEPGGRPLDTNYSTPVVAVINGLRLLIGGYADGSIQAMKVRTGEKMWEFKLSKGAINTSVVVEGNRVYATHSEENLDNTAMGRVVCIDGTGSGDITKTHEVWRADNLEVGYASPALHNGMLYLVDNSANLICLDATTGKEHWKYNLGTVGKGSPVLADGKMYVGEVNGLFHILQPSATECKSLDAEKLTLPSGRYAEIYGSPAIAYNRVYFTAESGLYCLGDKNASFSFAHTPTLTLTPTPENPPDKNAKAAHLQIVPAEVLASPGQKIKFRTRAFDDKGRFLREVNAEWSPNDVAGAFSKNGELTIDKNKGSHAGTITATFENLQGAARVRVIADVPWQEDFESTEEGKVPSYFVGHGNKFNVAVRDGNKVLVKPPARVGLNRSDIFLGPPTMKNYAIQADMMGTQSKRTRPDMGLTANRYTLDLMGLQRLQIRTWGAELVESKTIDFKWEPEVWYTMKMQVDVVGNKATVKGKVWPRSEKEPEQWTITMEDNLPNLEGSPGIYGYSPAEIYYDNIKITGSK
jgi:outer membrane protein assembly factor BamB